MPKPPTGSIDGVPMPTIWRLMTLAEKRGVRMVDLLNEIAVTGTVQRPDQPRLALTTQQRVAVMHARGMTPQAMAAELGMHRQTVHYHLKRIRSATP